MKRNIKLPIMVLSSTLLFSGISPVLAEDATKDSDLETRVEQLEQRVSDLESQIAELLKLLDRVKKHQLQPDLMSRRKLRKD